MAAAFENGLSDVAIHGCSRPQQLRKKLAPVSTEHPEVYRHFEEGYHTLWRSDRYWAGLSADLIIEQVLMRSLKTTGGLTRGSGMTESQRRVWLLSTPACAQVNSAMQELTEVSYTISDQHNKKGT